MRLLHLCSRYWPGVGGGENYLQEISARLAAEGHQVTVATTDAAEAALLWDPSRRRLTDLAATHRGVAIRRFPIQHLPFAPKTYALWRYVIFLWLASTPLLPVSALTWLARFTPWSPALWRWLETTPETFEVVGVTGIVYESFVAAAAYAARRWRVPWVVHPFTHLGAGVTPGRDPVSRYYTMRHQVALVRAADAVVAQTETERAFYCQRGVAPARIEVIGPGVDPAEAAAGDAQRFRARWKVSGPLVGFVSAMAYDKGATHLVEAIRQLWRQGTAVELVLAGAMTPQFKTYLAGLPEPERQRVRVLGSISEADKQDLLEAVDLLAMPSRTDSFGIIYLEAWLHRKPVIGSSAWGMSDVIQEGEDGRLVPFGDVPALAAAIAQLLENPTLRAALGGRGEQKVRARHTWDFKYQQFRALYTRLGA